MIATERPFRRAHRFSGEDDEALFYLYRWRRASSLRRKHCTPPGRTALVSVMAAKHLRTNAASTAGWLAGDSLVKMMIFTR